MENIHEQLQAHLKAIDRLIPFKAFSNETLQEWMAPLIESIDDDGSVSYLIKGKARYRASPLASTIIWLSREKLLPDNVLNAMQNELLYLRDKPKENDSSLGCEAKQDEDSDGWSLAEGVSVWSTSMAIIALSDENGIGLLKAEKFKKSVIWLANQRNAELKGWGYQNTDNCTVNVIMTALTVRALALCFTKTARKCFAYNHEDEILIQTAIKKGAEYLIEACITKPKYVYWQFNGIPSCVATTWSLVALKEAAKVIPEQFSEFLNNHTKKGITFVLSKLPPKVRKWEEEKLVEETGAKYDSQKNYYSFSAALLPELFSLGVSPYHTKVIKQLRWIIKNRNDWKTKYDKREICSFTYAMLISTIMCWVRQVGIINAVQLIKNCNTIPNKITEFFLGYPVSTKMPFIRFEKKKIVHFGAIILLIVVFLIVREKATYIVQKAISAILPSEAQLDSIWINLVSSALYGFICFVFFKLFGFFVAQRGNRS